MSQLCHICGPVKHEAPTVMCAPCAFDELERGLPVDFVVNTDGETEIRRVEVKPGEDPRCDQLVVKSRSGQSA